MFNKERFHNELAMRLGYERIVKDKRIIIDVEDCDEPWVTLRFLGLSDDIRINVSNVNNEVELKNIPVEQEEVRLIMDAVHQAYIESCKSPF